MRRQRGITLIEILIAVLILSIGMLGMAGLQTQGLRANQSGYLKSMVTQLAYDMFDRMRANQAGFAGGFYDNPTPASAGCFSGTNCTPEQLAKEDVQEWKNLVGARLPGGAGVVCRDSTPDDGSSDTAPACDGSGNLYAVKIWWTDGFDRGTGSAITRRYVFAGRP